MTTTTRTSNKQIADKLDTLIDLLTAQSMAAPTVLEVATQAEVDAVIAPKVETPSEINVDAAYKAHMDIKCQAHANEKGAEVFLYARLNKRQETKLAYALSDRYSVVAKQPSCLGLVARYVPTA